MLFVLLVEECYRRARSSFAFIYTPLPCFTIQGCSAGDERPRLSVPRTFLSSASPFQKNLIKTYLNYWERESTKHTDKLKLYFFFIVEIIIWGVEDKEQFLAFEICQKGHLSLSVFLSHTSCLSPLSVSVLCSLWYVYSLQWSSVPEVNYKVRGLVWGLLLEGQQNFWNRLRWVNVRRPCSVLQPQACVCPKSQVKMLDSLSLLWRSQANYLHCMLFKCIDKLSLMVRVEKFIERSLHMQF